MRRRTVIKVRDWEDPVASTFDQHLQPRLFQLGDKFAPDPAAVFMAVADENVARERRARCRRRRRSDGRDLVTHNRTNELKKYPRQAREQAYNHRQPLFFGPETPATELATGHIRAGGITRSRLRFAFKGVMGRSAASFTRCESQAGEFHSPRNRRSRSPTHLTLRRTSGSVPRLSQV